MLGRRHFLRDRRDRARLVAAPLHPQLIRAGVAAGAGRARARARATPARVGDGPARPRGRPQPAGLRRLPARQRRRLDLRHRQRALPRRRGPRRRPDGPSGPRAATRAPAITGSCSRTPTTAAAPGPGRPASSARAGRATAAWRVGASPWSPARGGSTSSTTSIRASTTWSTSTPARWTPSSAMTAAGPGRRRRRSRCAAAPTTTRTPRCPPTGSSGSSRSGT